MTGFKGYHILLTSISVYSYECIHMCVTFHMPVCVYVTWITGIALILTHWGRVTHICVSESPIIGSDNGLSPGRRQAIIWTNAGTLLIRTLGINISEILSEIHTFSFKKMYLKMSSGKRRPFCLGLNVLKPVPISFEKYLIIYVHGLLLHYYFLSIVLNLTVFVFYFYIYSSIYVFNFVTIFRVSLLGLYARFTPNSRGT